MGTNAQEIYATQKLNEVPVLRAKLVYHDGRAWWRVRCPHCRTDHDHAPVPGWHPAGCQDSASSFHWTGYRLVLADD